MFRAASLFSGIGGFDLPADWMGWETVFTCEINPFGRKILQYYWPNAICYEDITKTDFTIHRGQIDILTGGFPCQPYSQAGKRLGKEDDRHLWPQMLRAIQEISPRWIVDENVRGLVNWNGGMVFDEVQADLEAEGYEVWPFLLPACGVNAPHRRDRVWFVAYNYNRNREEIRFQAGRKKHLDRNEGDRTSSEPRGYINTPQRESSEIERTGSKRPNGLPGLQRNATNASSSKPQRGIINGSAGSQGQAKTNSRQSSRSVCSQWKEFPTQSPVCCRNDGISNRLDGITFPKWRQESIKAYGNAVVPQVVYQIFKAIAETDK